MGDTFQGNLNKIESPEQYLPKQVNEPPEAYESRLKRSPYQNHVAKVIKAHSGAISGVGFDPDVPMPAELERIGQNVDLRNSSLEVFFDLIDVRSMRDVYCFVLCDYYKDGEVENRREEMEADSQPFFRVIDPRNVPNWHEECGRIQSMTIAEIHCTPSKYGAIEKPVFRVIEGDSWRIVEVVETQSTDKKWIEKPVTDEDGRELAGRFLRADGNPLGYCPIQAYCLTAGDWADGDLPEFLQLADLNIRHYQSCSELWELIHCCCTPTPWFALSPGNELYRKLTEGAGLSLGNHDYLLFSPDNSCGYLQASSDAIAPARESVKDLELALDSYSLANIASGAQRTATEIRTLFNDTQKKLTRFARQKESAINNLLMMFADYLGLDRATMPECTVACDIAALLTDEQSIVALYQGGLLSRESAVNRLNQLGFNANATDELLRLERAEEAEVSALAGKLTVEDDALA
jgi:hypothetical protein